MTNNSTQSPSHGWLVTKSLGKASLGLLNPKIWLLSVIPFAIAAVLWAGLAWFAWEPMNNIARTVIGSFGLPTWLNELIPTGLSQWLDSMRTVWAPLVVMTLVIPLVMLTVFVLVSVLGSAAVANHVAKQYALEPLTRGVAARSISVAGAIWHSTWVLSVFIVFWILTLPLWLLPGIGFVVPLLLLAWANARLFTRDALVDFATPTEMLALKQQHGSTLFLLGVLASLPAALPSFLWLFGGVMVLALPLMTGIAVWLYVMIFLATALLFSHYTLSALSQLRSQLNNQVHNETGEAKGVVTQPNAGVTLDNTSDSSNKSENYQAEINTAETTKTDTNSPIKPPTSASQPRPTAPNSPPLTS